MSPGESTGRARLIAEKALEYHKVIEGEYGCNGQTCPGVKRLVNFANDVIAAAEALAGQEEAPQQKDGEEEDHARGGSVPGTEHGDLSQRTTGDS